MLADAGIQVILDHHALPGVQTGDQTFTGKYVLGIPYNGLKINDLVYPVAVQTLLYST